MWQKKYFVFVVLAICATSLKAHSAGPGPTPPTTPPAKTARQLVHQNFWTPMGTISTDSAVAGYPMVNTIAVDDSTISGESTGKIHFLLTDVDFTGKDWHESNRVTCLFSDDQNLRCKTRDEDTMEPTCTRAYVTGKVIKMDIGSVVYNNTLNAFIKRHPAAENWIHHAPHSFYLCELDIEHIYVLDFYGGPKTVTPQEYYDIKL